MRHTILESFRHFGYQEVSPPLVEFEDSLLEQSSLDRQTFRVMDPSSQKMMGIRADMTPQIARIAANRMADAPLPLRLGYAGTCLRIKGEGLQKRRQLVQAGIECIGAEDTLHLIEILRCALSGLEAVEVDDLVLDVTLPGLTHELLESFDAAERQEIQEAISQKDRHRIQATGHALSSILLALIDGITAEEIESLLPKLPSMAAKWLKKVNAFTEAFPNLTITLDPLEESGFGYYEGIAFSLFSTQLACEIGRGGHYRAHENLPAYGLTLYLTPLLEQRQSEDNTPRCYVMPQANEEICADLRKKGWYTLYGSARSAAEAKIEASAQGCQHLLEKDEVINV